MSNVVVVNSNQVPTFQNEELNKATREIFEYDKNIRLNYFKIADALRWIKGLELYKEDGFKSVSEYASQVFGYEKSTVSRMIKIAEDYLLEDGSSTVFVQEGKDFSISQLREVLALPRGEVVDLVQEGQITPDMTKDQIRAVVKKAKKNQKSSNQNDISVEEENIAINESCASATGENRGINLGDSSIGESSEQTNLSDDNSVSSSGESTNESIESQTPSQTAQNALESTFDSSLVSEYQDSSETSSEGLQSFSGDNNSISSLEEEHELKLEELIENSPKELRDYILLLEEEVKRLKEENFKLAHPVKRGRGRPRKERNDRNDKTN